MVAGASLMAQMVKNLPAVQETQVGKIPWTEEPGGLQSMGSPRVRTCVTEHAKSTHSDMKTWTVNLKALWVCAQLHLTLQPHGL